MFTDIVKYYTQKSYSKHGCCCVRLNKYKGSSENSEDSRIKIVLFFAPGALQHFYITAISIAAYDHHILLHAYPAFLGLFLDFHSRLLVDKIH